MSNSTNVFINGDKSKFKSKSAIKRLKIFLKKNVENNDYNLEDNSFLVDGYKFKIKKEENNFNVDILLDNKSKKLDNDNRKKLKEKLRSMRELRSGKTIRYAKELKEKNSKNVLKSFFELNKTFDVPVPKPEEILNNPEKYTEMAKLYASGVKLSPDNKMNSLLGKYFTNICNMLNIEPSNPNNLNMDKINELASKFYDNKNAFTNDPKSDNEKNNVILIKKMII